MRIRKADVVAAYDGNIAAVARLWKRITPDGRGLTRPAVSQWGEFLPPLRAHELVRAYPEHADLVIDEETGLSLREMRALATAAQAGTAG